MFNQITFKSGYFQSMHNVMSEEIMLITIPHVRWIFNNENVLKTKISHPKFQPI